MKLSKPVPLSFLPAQYCYLECVQVIKVMKNSHHARQESFLSDPTARATPARRIKHGLASVSSTSNHHKAPTHQAIHPGKSPSSISDNAPRCLQTPEKRDGQGISVDAETRLPGTHSSAGSVAPALVLAARDGVRIGEVGR